VRPARVEPLCAVSSPSVLDVGDVPTPAALGVVAIGRNEGERLVRCLCSVSSHDAAVVYVDSGSTDGSVRAALGLRAKVVALDMTQPFTAARARNAGLQRLRDEVPSVEYVQFIDGDCEMVAGWQRTAMQFLLDNPRVAAVCGRRRERFPQQSIFNRLCDMEWATPVGQALACGGDVLMRAAALAQVGGYRDELIAGEEPELCVRLRAAGWQVWRLDAEMTLHDAAMTRWSQWWKRTMRSGYAYAWGASLHGHLPERHGVVQSRRALVWGALLPFGIAMLAMLHPVYMGLALAYPLQALRLGLRDGISRSDARLRAVAMVLARFPEAQGVLKFHLDRLLRRRAALIEYK
jgi:glycosyltransferase involved in cell wall biosynthesis